MCLSVDRPFKRAKPEDMDTSGGPDAENSADAAEDDAAAAKEKRHIDAFGGSSRIAATISALSCSMSNGSILASSPITQWPFCCYHSWHCADDDQQDKCIGIMYDFFLVQVHIAVVDEMAFVWVQAKLSL